MSDSVLNLDQLLAPIAGDNPAGENLRWDPVYDEINSLRPKTDRDPFGDDEPPPADWRPVIETASDALANRTKDLTIASWLVEALVHRHGFAGFRDGLKLLTGLMENFWDHIYPQIDEGDLEPRVAPLVSLTSPDKGPRLPNILRELPLAADRGDGVSYSFIYSRSRVPQPKGENEPEESFVSRRAAAEEKGRKFDDAVARSPAKFYQNLHQDFQECRAELVRLDNDMDARFDRLAPGISALRQALDDIEGLLRPILKQKGILDPAGGDAAAGDEGVDGAGGGGGGGGIDGPIRSREDAYHRLSEIAAYLRQTDPHSPVPYLVERAVAWGQMPLLDLLAELVADENMQRQIRSTLGIKDSQSESSGY